MGLAVLIEHGVRSLSKDRTALEQEIGRERAAAALTALGKLPAVLSGLNALAWAADATPLDRAALTVVVSYGLKTNDLVPARGERTLLGVLDDAYLAFCAAARVRGPLPDLTREEITVGVTALAAALPGEVVEQLEHDLSTALSEIEAYTKGDR